MAQPVSAYRLFPGAESDLESLYDYTVETWSNRQADYYQTQLVKAFEGLVSGSRIGRDAGVGNGILKLNVRSQVVFDQINEGSINIVRVLHQAMDVMTRFEP